MPSAIVKPVIDRSVRGLCIKPYPGHPKGCPNHGKRATCPPLALLIGEVLDLDDIVWVIWNRFNFARHVERMRARHSDWSRRQLECCLYWQGTARKALRAEIEEFKEGRREWGLRLVVCPEACGVDVTATMDSIGVHLEWPPKRFTYQVALAGTPARSVGRRRGKT